MKKLGRYVRASRGRAFSLVEVVLALGVVSFAIVAILGVLPLGLQTSHYAQDETRAAQIAQAVLTSIAAQASTQFSSVQLKLDDNSTTPIDLNGGPDTKTVFADNDGKLVAAQSGAVYAVTIATNNALTGFDPGYANQVTVTVAWPAAAPTPSRTKRDYVRIISKYQ